MKSILDPTFCYTPSFDTDLRRTFARIRRELPPQMRRSAHAVEHGFPARILNLADASRLRTLAIGSLR
jgi:hypothetical protein